MRVGVVEEAVSAVITPGLSHPVAVVHGDRGRPRSPRRSFEIEGSGQADRPLDARPFEIEASSGRQPPSPTDATISSHPAIDVHRFVHGEASTDGGLECAERGERRSRHEMRRFRRIVAAGRSRHGRPHPSDDRTGTIGPAAACRHEDYPPAR
jgi:hypothetical protein